MNLSITPHFDYHTYCDAVHFVEKYWRPVMQKLYKNHTPAYFFASLQQKGTIRSEMI